MSASARLDGVSRSLGESITGGSNRGHDYNHATDAHYEKLRSEAHQASGRHQHYAAEAKQAYERGDKAEASRLSGKSKEFEAQANNLNQEAAQWVFRANNADSQPDEIDLHGLFVHEAISCLDYRVHASLSRNEDHLRVIVGKGLHSENHIAKLKPAVEDYCRKQGFPAHLDHHNAGVLVVSLKGQALGQGQPQGYGGYAPPPGYTQHNAQPHAPHGTHGQTHTGGLDDLEQYMPQKLRRRISLIKRIFRVLAKCFS